jgi:protein-tyrosine-phosphatase
MAEGFLRQLAGDRFDVFSAGTEPANRVHPLAVEVMAERASTSATKSRRTWASIWAGWRCGI